jgi:hypothetical protein
MGIFDGMRGDNNRMSGQTMKMKMKKRCEKGTKKCSMSFEKLSFSEIYGLSLEPSFFL